MGDACLGLRQLVRAAISQSFREPMRSGVFLPKSDVQEALRADGRRLCRDEAVLKSVKCSNIKASRLFNIKDDMYNIKGVAILTCRHDQARKRLALEINGSRML